MSRSFPDSIESAQSRQFRCRTTVETTVTLRDFKIEQSKTYSEVIQQIKNVTRLLDGRL